MNLDLTIGVSDILILMSTAVVIVTGWVKLQGGVKSAQAAAEAAASVAAEAQKRADRAHDDLAAFKIEVAQKFATEDMLATLEKRVIEAIERLGDRLDRLVDSRIPRRRESGD